TFTYTAAPDYTGMDTFTYTLDGGSSATVTIRVVEGDASMAIEPPLTEYVAFQSAANPAAGSIVVNVPQGALAASMTLVYKEEHFDSRQSPPGFSFGGLFFVLDAYTGTEREESFVFNQPVTLTLSYDPTQLWRTPQLFSWHDGWT